MSQIIEIYNENTLNINRPPDTRRVMLFRRSNISRVPANASAAFVVKWEDGFEEPIAGAGSNSFIAAVGSYSFPGTGLGIEFVDLAVPEAQTTSIVLLTEKGSPSSAAFSYDILVDGTLRIYTTAAQIASTVVYTIINTL